MFIKIAWKMRVNIPVILLTIVVPTFSSSIKTYMPFSSVAETQMNIDGNRWNTKFEPSHSNVIKRSTQANSPTDDSTSDIGKYVDLHKDEFCVDVSTYGPIKYDEKSLYTGSQERSGDLPNYKYGDDSLINIW